MQQAFGDITAGTGRRDNKIVDHTNRLFGQPARDVFAGHPDARQFLGDMLAKAYAAVFVDHPTGLGDQLDRVERHPAPMPVDGPVRARDPQQQPRPRIIQPRQPTLGQQRVDRRARCRRSDPFRHACRQVADLYRAVHDGGVDPFDCAHPQLAEPFQTDPERSRDLAACQRRPTRQHGVLEHGPITHIAGCRQHRVQDPQTPVRSRPGPDGQDPFGGHPDIGRSARRHRGEHAP